MKFDFVIGNPPYQDERKGQSKTAQPVYHEFIEAAIKVGKVIELITPARFLFNAGGTPKDWNQKMLEDKHFKVLEYEPDASKMFSDTDIKGGVAITYRDTKKDFGAIGVFTAYSELNSIVHKVKIKQKESVSSICFVASKFNTKTLFSDYKQYEGHERRMSSNVLEFDCFHDEKKENDLMVYGVQKGKRTIKYIDAKYIDLTDKNISKYKIVTPKADGSGAFGATLTNPEVLNPNSVFTHTFLGLGGFESKTEADNALKYIKTKYTRALLSILKITQDLNADKWEYVPLQNFTKKSDIDWTQPIRDIDQQLYKKYKLTKAEIAFIENNVKEMD